MDTFHADWASFSGSLRSYSARVAASSGAARDSVSRISVLQLGQVIVGSDTGASHEIPAQCTKERDKGPKGEGGRQMANGKGANGK